MRTHFAKKTYGQRWQVETVFSTPRRIFDMIKRRQGDSLAARTCHSQNRALRLMVLTHNIMILWRQFWGFLQSKNVPIVLEALLGRPLLRGRGGPKPKRRA